MINFLYLRGVVPRGDKMIEATGMSITIGVK
jgi:hypothetical protein